MAKAKAACTHAKVTWKSEMVQTASGIFNVGTCDRCHEEVEQEFGPKALRVRTGSMSGAKLSSTLTALPKHIELLFLAAAGLLRAARTFELTFGAHGAGEDGSLADHVVRKSCDLNAEAIIAYLKAEGYTREVEEAGWS